MVLVMDRSSGHQRCKATVNLDEMIEEQTRTALTKLKKKKTRRGKKKTLKSLRDRINHTDILGLEEENSNNACADCGVSPLRESKDSIFKMYKRNSRGTLRPRYSPKAPHNSTQFLMDDQYMEFPSDKTQGNTEDSDNSHSVSFYEYSNIQQENFYDDYGINTLFRDEDDGISKKLCSDTAIFMEVNFESEYRDVRSEELKKMSTKELCDSIIHMEDKASQLESELEMMYSDSRESNIPVGKHQKYSNVICKLKEENRRLQNENEYLRNSVLTS